jgi:hypothetical protein
VESFNKNTSTIFDTWKPQQLRCSGCEHLETARLPGSIRKDELSANALVALYSYGVSLTFYRLQGLQSLFGIPPLSDLLILRSMLFAANIMLYNL